MKVFKIGTSSSYGGCVAFSNMVSCNEEYFFQQLNYLLDKNHLSDKKKLANKIGTLRKGVSIDGIAFQITNIKPTK